VPETVPEILKHIDDLGGPNSYGHYAAGWCQRALKTSHRRALENQPF
jgi:hypothetical protein